MNLSDTFSGSKQGDRHGDSSLALSDPQGGAPRDRGLLQIGRIDQTRENA